MHDAVVVGAGHAGLSISRALTNRGIDHVVLERGRVAQTWRGRWDSFCLVTPNWLIALTDSGYDGDDPTATCLETRSSRSSSDTRPTYRYGKASTSPASIETTTASSSAPTRASSGRRS